MESIRDQTKGVDICNAVCCSLDPYSVKLQCMVGVTTDGALAMIRRKTSTMSLLSEKVAKSGGEKLTTYHCILNQDTLAA